MSAQGRDDVLGAEPRRRFLTGLAALGASAVISGCQTIGRAPAETSGKLHRIDVHHHMVSPRYSEALKTHGIRPVSWTAQASIEEMDKSGIAVSVLSLPAPSVAFGDAPLARQLARDANEYAARVKADYPGRYGSFAAIPLLDADGSLVEIEYALDTLKAEGIALMTSYGGKYLGDSAFSPVLEELNRRKAVIYTHPIPPQCCARILPYTSPNTIRGPGRYDTRDGESDVRRSGSTLFHHPLDLLP